MIRTSNKVALYARFSSDNQRSESIDAQIRAMTAYCEQHHFVIVKTYIDEAKSATTDRRPAFQQMIHDSSSRLFNILLVHKLDRFARNRYDSAVYKRELKKNGVIVYSVLENLDDSPESIMMEAVLEGMSEYYSQNLAREVMKGLRETALQCKHTGGKPPLGYDVDPLTKRLVINPEEAETVKLIFSMYSRGCGYSSILDKLHALGRKTKSGNEFQKNSLYSILSNPKYQGMYVFNRASAKNSVGKRNTHLYKDDEEIIFVEGGCPQIIDHVTFARVQDILTSNKHAGRRNTARECYMLSGKVFCRECGRSMVGNMRHSGSSKTLYVTYRCLSRKTVCHNKEINRDYLEHYIVGLIEAHILNASALRKLKNKILKHMEVMPQEDNEDVLPSLREIEDAIRNVTDAIEAGLLSDALVARLKTLEEEKARLQKFVSERRMTVHADEIDPPTILAQYHEVKKTPASPAYRLFIRDFIDRIEVGRYSVRVILKTGLDVAPELDTAVEVRRQEIYEEGKTV